MTRDRSDQTEGASMTVEIASTARDAHLRALHAEPRLMPLERMVETLCAIAPTDEPMCVGCVWEIVLKPLVSPLVGWERGFPQRQAKDPDPDPDALPPLLPASEFLAVLDEIPAADTETEAWMRTSEAWHAITDPWLRQLDDVDPALGHGLPGLDWRSAHGQEKATR